LPVACYEYIIKAGKYGEAKMNEEISILYTTVANFSQAEELAKGAVIGKFAGCANIIPDATSIYEWEEALIKTQEFIIIFKTTPSKLAKLEQWLGQNHPYDTPAILSWSAASTLNFANFIRNQTI
jgi:periplasmic divalent cation tolerance protein